MKISGGYNLGGDTLSLSRADGGDSGVLGAGVPGVRQTVSRRGVVGLDDLDQRYEKFYITIILRGRSRGRLVDHAVGTVPVKDAVFSSCTVFRFGF
ncbi:MAG: hypothetical protein CMJ80_16515 [Planctomycetaceae bacterium]|nr:hypothetical protein [Planctomycetaceae bacterium]